MVNRHPLAKAREDIPLCLERNRQALGTPPYLRDLRVIPRASREIDRHSGPLPDRSEGKGGRATETSPRTFLVFKPF